MSESSHDFIDQRKHARLSADSIGQLVCTIPFGMDKAVRLESTDICPGGFGAIIPAHCQGNIRKGCEFTHCQINLPGLTDISVRVANLWLLRTKDGGSSFRAGFEFTSPIDWSMTGLDSPVAGAA